MNKILRRLAASALVITIAACSDPSRVTAVSEQEHRCTLVGCDDTLVATLEGFLEAEAHLPITFHVCLDDRPCEMFWVGMSPAGPVCSLQNPKSALIEDCWVSDGRMTFLLSIDPEGAFDKAEHAVRLNATTQGGAAVFSDEQTGMLTKRQPNGPACEPTCYQGGVSFVWQGTDT